MTINCRQINSIVIAAVRRTREPQSGDLKRPMMFKATGLRIESGMTK
jgi:hypothetical protein